MKIPWILGGVLFGKAILGKWGMAVGGAVGYWLAPDRGTARHPRTVATARKQPEAPVAPPGAGKIKAQERYPEEKIIDAMRESEQGQP